MVAAVDWKLISAQYRSAENQSGSIRAYSLCTDGRILESNGWQSNTPSIDINEHISAQNKDFKVMKWTCFCVEDSDDFKNENGQKMAMGCDEGSIFVLDGSWKILQCFNDYNSPISSIQISPFVHADQNGQKLICAGTQNGELIFYKFPSEESSPNRILFTLKHSAKNKAISKVKWHPFCSNVIVSISKSNKYPLKIWNVSKQQKIFEIESDTYQKLKLSHFAKYHHSKILSVAWSRCDPFVLFSASEDQTCRRLNLSSFTKSDIASLDQMKFICFKSSQSSQPIIDKTAAPPKQQQSSEKSKMKQKKHKKLFQSFDADKIDNSLMHLVEYFASFICSDLQPFDDRKLSPNDLLFLSASDIEKDRISKWMSSMLQPQQTGAYPVSFLSSPSNQIQHFLTNDSDPFIEREIDSFVKAKNEKIPKLPSLLSLLISPTLGRQKWESAMLRLCEYYKHPQIALYHIAASIYLSMKSPQFVRECIEMYIEADYLLEALLVARHHLVSNHPIFEDILSRYAQKSLAKKQFILAIKCRLSKLTIFRHSSKEIYTEHFIKILKENVFGILLKFYFFPSFQSDNAKKRKIGKMEVHSLQILHDLNVLLHSMKNEKITEFL